MAYDDGGRRYPDGYGPPDDSNPPAHGDYRDDPPGYSSSPDYRDDPYSASSDLPTADNRYTPDPVTAIGDRLDHVYDEVGGRDANDRLLVHIVLEVVLMLAAAGVFFWARSTDSTLFEGTPLKHLVLGFSAVLLLATATALTLRVRAVNLGLFAFALAAAALFFKFYDGQGTAIAAVVAVGACLGAGLVLALLILLFKVPGWAAGLGVGLALFAGVESIKLPALAPDYAFNINDRGVIVLGLAAALSIVGGVVGSLPGTRRLLGACRDGDTGGRRTRGAVTLTLFGTLGSTALAGVAGVVIALGTAQGMPTGPTSQTALLYGGLALAGALLGGTSAQGRRGGFAGTLLGTAVMVGVVQLGAAQDWHLHPAVYVAGGLVAGLVATWLVETLGKPDEVPDYSADDGKRERDRESFASLR
ncbi:hypothetical protein [Phytomonospora endophytica]|uniref:Uncharacterized protein n=1 Tax=Phytomonospora endophytica TaxID=714109 RepID=A0A841FZ97_9ACTN|nr:hypothetical protein [Phytomonospora endophytica]MBB6039038.1 hypothetical protein [Phytomonospora endophytica]GIG69516.1 hypothetical protein Pen01_58110 [Phytomonospora endophytica]